VGFHASSKEFDLTCADNRSGVTVAVDGVNSRDGDLWGEKGASGVALQGVAAETPDC